MWGFKKKKAILALGGGGARGLTSIGVLKVLDRYYGKGQLPFDLIIGTSMGSLIGAAYCLGVPLDELEQKAGGFNWTNIVDIGFRPTGLVKGDKFEHIIVEIMGKKGFEDMKIPFALTTTDIVTGEGYTHNSGDLIKLVRASCSWPGIFTVVRLGGKLLADGGVSNSVPTKSAVKFGADVIVAVNPGFGVKKTEPKNAIHALIQTVQIMGEELNSYQSKIADVVIKPELKELDQFDFDKAETIIKQGELATEEKMEELTRILH